MPMIKKPTALRVLHGDEKRYINTDEPTPAPGRPEPPADMEGAARAVWDYIVPELDAMNLVTRPDRDQIAAYCEAVALHAQALAFIRKAGVLIRDRDKAVRVNPAARVVNAQQRSMLLWAREFGLTPSARAHLHASQLAEDRADVETMLG
jgi:P27 family predicted phage terminase small subunit